MKVLSGFMAALSLAAMAHAAAPEDCFTLTPVIVNDNGLTPFSDADKSLADEVSADMVVTEIGACFDDTRIYSVTTTYGTYAAEPPHDRNPTIVTR